MAEAHDVDLDKPGFFHFNEKLVKGQLPRQKAENQYKSWQQVIKYCPQDGPNVGAIQNLLGILTYAIDGKDKAIRHFESLLKNSKFTKVNTLANLIFLYGDESKDAATLRQELKHLQNDKSPESQLEVARGMCERGYIYGYFTVQEFQEKEMFKASVRQLNLGIEKGEKFRMNLKEKSIWMYYRVNISKRSNNDHEGVKNIAKQFGYLMTTFLECYQGLEDCYYKSIALMLLVQLFTYNRNSIKVLPNFSKFCEHQKFLRDIWADPGKACEDAIEMDAGNHKTHLAAAGVFTTLKNYKKAESCVDKSLEIESDFNIGAMNRRMAILRNMAMQETTQNKTKKQFLLKAFAVGKDIEKQYGHVTTPTLVEVCDVCFNLAIDRHVWPWKGIPGMEKYFHKAVEYGQKAVDRKNRNLRAFRLLAYCFIFKNQYEKAADYMKQACDDDDDEPGYTYTLWLYLITLSETYHRKAPRAQVAVVEEIATAMVEGWEKHHAHTKMQDLFLDYGNLRAALQNALIQKVLEELNRKKVENADVVLQEFCTAIVKKPSRTKWLTSTCQKYLPKK